MIKLNEQGKDKLKLSLVTDMPTDLANAIRRSALEIPIMAIDEIDIIKNDSGQGIYLIGKFLTFESAAEYADLLARNGQKEAKVVAYLGNREISVETAKQLFDKF